jgi:hypothetical protein
MRDKDKDEEDQLIASFADVVVQNTLTPGQESVFVIGDHNTGEGLEKVKKVADRLRKEIVKHRRHDYSIEWAVVIRREARQ